MKPVHHALTDQLVRVYHALGDVQIVLIHDHLVSCTVGTLQLDVNAAVLTPEIWVGVLRYCVFLKLTERAGNGLVNDHIVFFRRPCDHAPKLNRGCYFCSVRAPVAPPRVKRLERGAVVRAFCVCRFLRGFPRVVIRVVPRDYVNCLLAVFAALGDRQRGSP